MRAYTTRIRRFGNMTSFQLVGMGKNGVKIMMSNDVQSLSPRSPGSLREPVAQSLPHEIDQAALEGVWPIVW